MRNGVVLGALLLIAVGCGDSSSDVDTISPAGSGEVTAMVSAAEGGRLATADGILVLEIPPDALQADTEIAIRPLAADDLALIPSDAAIVHAVLDLEPDGLTFEAPITIIRRVDAATLGVDLSEQMPLLWQFGLDDGAASVLEDQSITVDGDALILSASTRHFSGNGIVDLARGLYGNTLSVKLTPSEPTIAVGSGWRSTIAFLWSPGTAPSEVNTFATGRWATEGKGTIELISEEPDPEDAPAAQAGEWAEFECRRVGSEAFSFSGSTRARVSAGVDFGAEVWVKFFFPGAIDEVRTVGSVSLDLSGIATCVAGPSGDTSVTPPVIDIDDLDAVADLIGQGIGLNLEERYEEAIAVYDEALRTYGDRTDPEFAFSIANALVGKGTALQQLGRYEEAAAAYAEVAGRYLTMLDRDPELTGTLVFAMYSAANALALNGDTGEAIKQFDLVIKTFGFTEDERVQMWVDTARIQRDLVEEQQP